MRHLHTESPFRRALYAHQDADGYVETLLELARSQCCVRRAEISFSATPTSTLRDRREARARALH